MKYRFLFEADWKVIIIILGIVVGLLVVIYFMLSHHRFKKGARKFGNELSVKHSIASNNVQKMMNEIKKSRNYNGTYNSLSGKAKSRCKKYFYSFMEDIPLFITILYKVKSERPGHIHLGATDSYDSSTYSSQWLLNTNKSKNNNYNRLVKFINKNKACFGVFETLTNIFDFEKENEKTRTKDIETFPFAKENDVYIKYVPSRHKW